MTGKEAPLETYVIPNQINGTTLNTVGHFNAPNIKRIIIKEGFSRVDSFAFACSTNLEMVRLTKNIKIIDSKAFYKCSKLESITIPKSTNYIGEDAFSGCTNLKTVNYEGTEEDWKAINIDSNNDELKNVKINYNYKYQE